MTTTAISLALFQSAGWCRCGHLLFAVWYYASTLSLVLRLPVFQGGLVVVGCSGEHPFVPCELFDEESNRWYELPHGMVEPRVAARAVSVPADALRRQRR